jgi:uncharacterized protein YprB with RNaseH-like and TPR domain
MLTSKPRVAVLDIETSALDAIYGRMLCACWCYEGESKVHTISLADFPKQYKKDPTDDTVICKALSKMLQETDIVVTFYGERFDMPFIQSRCLANGLPPIPNITNIDLWRTCRSKLRLYSNRLAVVQKFLELPDSKTEIEARSWVRAKCGFKADLEYVIDHCIADVKVTMQAYQKLKPLINPCPAFFRPKKLGSELISCAKCGSSHVQHRGAYICTARRYARLQCQNCGTWFKGEWLDRKK